VLIQRVVAPNPGPMTLTGTNTYLVGNAAGDLAVIDPGPDDTPQHLDAILQAARPLGRITTVLVTHHHSDHLPAAVPLCAHTGARCTGHPDLPGVQVGLRDDEPAFGSLVALETPGHTRDSLCFWDASEGVLFTGDIVLGYGTAVLDDQPGALTQYISSLERLHQLQPRTIYPGHGPIVEDGSAKLREYLDHRRLRVRQVVETLTAQGPSTVDQLVTAIYVDTPPNLFPMAARNVRANLELLAAEGTVLEAGGERWQMAPTR
jgi:glyoxylase-like metal-dependent hydrolase (beta-lactamase superfamily II)